MKENTREELLDVIGSYLQMILRSADDFPTVVLGDIKASAKGVLKGNNYSGRYAKCLQDGVKEATYFSVWEEGIVGTSCFVNMKTGEVFDIKQIEGGNFETFIREYVVIDGQEREVFCKDEAEGKDFFWRE